VSFRDPLLNYSRTGFPPTGSPVSWSRSLPPRATARSAVASRPRARHQGIRRFFQGRSRTGCKRRSGPRTRWLDPWAACPSDTTRQHRPGQRGTLWNSASQPIVEPTARWGQYHFQQLRFGAGFIAVCTSSAYFDFACDLMRRNWVRLKPAAARICSLDSSCR
jgi:hypothetical protein